jgi:hypothetical protein
MIETIDKTIDPVLRDVRIQMLRVRGDDSIVAEVYGDYYIGAENNYQPIYKSITVDLDGLFRLQREVAEAIQLVVIEGLKSAAK